VAIAVTYDAVMRMTVVVVALLAACSSDPGPIIDARLGDAPAVDGQILGDGGANDAPDLDGAPDLDAPALDAPDLDAAALDAAPLDAPALDATPLDAGVDAFVCTADGVACAGGTGVCCGGTCVTGACCTAADCGADPAGFVCTAEHACVDVAGTLDGLLWLLPCAPGATGTSCATTPTTSATATMGGTPGVTYDVTVRLRGVIEQKTYPAGCTSGAWSSGGSINGDPYNVYRITVSSPAQTYYVNAGTSNITHTWALDYQQTFRVDAGATVTLFADAVDGAEIRNLDATGTPISIPGVAVAQPYDGQFVQLDVVAVTPDPVASGATVGGGTPSFALRYDGAQVTTIANAPDLGPADVTMQAWVQVGALAGGFNTVFGRTYGGGNLDSYTLWSMGGQIRTGVAAANGFQQTAVAWTPGTAWHHLATTFDSAAGAVTMYIDGQAVACFPATAPLGYDLHDLLIGADIENGAIDGFWAGPIDEVRVMHTHRLGPTTGLVGEWTFDEGSGQTSADSSGLGHSATLGTSAGDTVRDPAWVAR
jgi:hypothetical protein